MPQSSMIVFQIDIDGLAFNPTESNAPVSARVDRVAALIAANAGVAGLRQGGEIIELSPYSAAASLT